MEYEISCREDGRALLVTIKERSEEPAYEYRMLEQNEVPGLLKIHTGRNQGMRYYEYETGSLTKLSLLADSEDLLKYLYPCVRALECLEEVLREYLLSPYGILGEPETVYVEETTGNVYFTYLPGAEVPLSVSLEKIMDFFMRHAEHLSQDEVLLVYGLYQKSREPNIGLSDLSDFYRNNLKETGDLVPPEKIYEDDFLYGELGMERVLPRKPNEIVDDPEATVLLTDLQYFAEMKEKEKGEEKPSGFLVFLKKCGDFLLKLIE